MCTAGPAYTGLGSPRTKAGSFKLFSSYAVSLSVQGKDDWTAAFTRSICGVSDFKQLVVWQKGHELALRAHRAASKIRKAHDISLRSQIIRCAFSIPANIVEGRRQESEKEFARFLKIALNSGVELEYHLIIARDIEAISHTECTELLSQVIEVRRMLHGLLKRLRTPTTSPSVQ